MFSTTSESKPSQISKASPFSALCLRLSNSASPLKIQRWILHIFVLCHLHRIEAIYGKMDYFGSRTNGLYHMGAVLMFSG
ncbi:hypothetical protein CMV_006172 [Castanea mollissima]|uniref:Uncharacterized protein n=1 Tax=Castanea mollissima TaxID=60419 RepID=A0A8J4RWW6_9ROSI|nr:hypothetical protein CMV_006172 [Castanea mollissima]